MHQATRIWCSPCAAYPGPSGTSEPPQNPGRFNSRRAPLLCGERRDVVFKTDAGKSQTTRLGHQVDQLVGGPPIAEAVGGVDVGDAVAFRVPAAHPRAEGEIDTQAVCGAEAGSL